MVLDIPLRHLTFTQTCCVLCIRVYVRVQWIQKQLYMGRKSRYLKLSMKITYSHLLNISHSVVSESLRPHGL